MANANNKTQATNECPVGFIAAISDDQKREDCKILLSLIEKISGYPPVLWGKIIGYGTYHYKYDSGREGDSLRIGFSPRAQYLSIYIMPGYQDFDDELSRLGKHKMGKSCLNIKRLSDVNIDVLEEIITKALTLMGRKYPDDTWN